MSHQLPEKKVNSFSKQFSQTELELGGWVGEQKRNGHDRPRQEEFGQSLQFEGVPRHGYKYSLAGLAQFCIFKQVGGGYEG